MRRRSLVIAATIILTLALATMALAADPFVGTWKLNVAKSKIVSLSLKSAIYKIESQDNGLKAVFDGTNADGTVGHIEWAAKFDDKDYPYKGNQTTDAIALKKVDANTIDRIMKKAGKEVGTGRNAVSKDGKTMTFTINGKNAQGQEIHNILVFDRQ